MRDLETPNVEAAAYRARMAGGFPPERPSPDEYLDPPEFDPGYLEELEAAAPDDLEPG